MTNEESKTEHRLFDSLEWIPCGVGMIQYSYNSIKGTGKGLHTTKLSSLVNNLHSIYQAGTLTGLLYITSNYLSN